tara:strand:+ start:5420 stop:6277 length:858 start_codon:yes stop_codon:yes gene_type:complete
MHRCPFIAQTSIDDLCASEPPWGFRTLCRDNRLHATELLGFPNPDRCHYDTCAVVGTSGTLIKAALGRRIDGHDAVFRVNLSPDGHAVPRRGRARREWVRDLGTKTTWRVVNIDVFSFFEQYSRNWLRPPRGHGTHVDMKGVKRKPSFAVVCHNPSTMGRCRMQRMRENFGHNDTVSHLVDPLVLKRMSSEHFKHVRGQRTLSTGMVAIAVATSMCRHTSVFGFGDARCPHACYHFYECSHNERDFFGRDGSQGFHNFSFQAAALKEMHRKGRIVLHDGLCSAER